MKVTNKQVVEESLVLIQLLQEHTNTVDAAASFIRHLEPPYATPVDFGNLREKLINLDIKPFTKEELQKIEDAASMLEAKLRIKFIDE